MVAEKLLQFKTKSRVTVAGLALASPPRSQACVGRNPACFVHVVMACTTAWDIGMILEIIIDFLIFDGVLAFLFWLLTANDFRDADDQTSVTSRDRAAGLFRAR